MPEGEEDKEVLGSLPRRRPGIESPRRADARAAAEQKDPRSAPASGAQPSGSGPGDLERLARAGVSLAGGATAAGLKLAGRAVGGLGRVVGRR